MLPTIFQRLCQVKTLHFESCSLPGSQMDWNCTGTGTTQVVQTDNLLSFTDCFQLDNGRLCSDQKQWMLDDNTLAFYHYRHQVFDRIFTFRLQDGQLITEKPYECMPDYYYGTLNLLNDAVILTINIMGTRKNEMIRYTYR